MAKRELNPGIILIALFVLLSMVACGADHKCPRGSESFSGKCYPVQQDAVADVGTTGPDLSQPDVTVDTVQGSSDTDSGSEDVNSADLPDDTVQTDNGSPSDSQSSDQNDPSDTDTTDT